MSFSAREMAILTHLSQGAENRLIARDLDTSEAVVYVHIRTLCHKLGVTTRAQVATWALGNQQFAAE